MYWEYFGFEENPFSISPDPRYLYMSKRHQEALAHLVYGIGEAGGFVLLSGEVGTGKTTICRSLIEQLPDTVDLAFVLNPRLNEIELLATICDEMGVSYPRPDPSLKVLVDRLNEHLLRAHAIGRQPVLLIDEAQNLDPKVLEQIRLLTNLETNKRKLLQIVLIGQPELNTLLARPDLRQLDQRITARYHLRPLTLQETGGYIRHRLQVGGAPIDIFSDAAIRAVFRATGGIPRLINTLCDRCLLGAYAENRRKVDAKLVKGAAKEVLNQRAKARPGLAIPGIFAAAAAAAAFFLIDPLDLNEPGIVMSVTEADQASRDRFARPDPVAGSVDGGAADSGPRALEDGSGLEVGNVAAAEMLGDDRSTIAGGAVGRPVPRPVEPAAATDLDAYPPPPPPAAANVTAPNSGAIMPRTPHPPVVPPSTAPIEVAAYDLGTDALAAPNGAEIEVTNNGDTGPDQIAAIQNDDANPVIDAVPGASQPASDEAAVRSSPKYQEGTWSAMRRQMPASVQLAELTPASKGLEPGGDLYAGLSLEVVLAKTDIVDDLESALSTLFAAWGYDYTEMKGLSPCKKARYAGLRCLQGQGTWHELKIANRPAIITLALGDSNPQYGVLTGVDGEQAEITLGNGATVSTNVGALARLWTGDFLLLWRPPTDFFRELKLGLRGDDVLWLRDRLSALGWDTSGVADRLSYDDGLQEAVRRFQRRRGLSVDGIAGPRTILQINVAGGATKAPTIQ